MGHQLIIEEKENEYEKDFCFLAMITIFSCLNAFSLSVNASAEKLYENFSEMTAEEFALLTADDAKYDVTAMMRFSYEDMNLADVSNCEKSERKAALKKYFFQEMKRSAIA